MALIGGGGRGRRISPVHAANKEGGIPRMLLNILHVITDLDPAGAEQMLTNLVLATSDKTTLNHIVVSVTDEGTFGPILRSAGIDVYSLNMRRGKPSLSALVKLVRIINFHKPDTIMTWLYHANLIGTLASMLAGNGMRQRLIWNLRCSNIDFSYYRRLSKWVFRILAFLSPAPAAIAANSERAIRYHIEHGYKPKRWIYLPNGVDCNKWRPDPADRIDVRTVWKFEKNTFAVGMVARSDPQKDYTTFLAAAERASALDERFQFILIGLGTEYLVIPRSLVGRIIVLGERHDVQKLLRGLDVLILSSAFGEGFPNVVAEAMATCIPCIVTDVGDAASIVAETGLVVPTRSPDALAKALMQLLCEIKRGIFKSVAKQLGRALVNTLSCMRSPRNIRLFGFPPRYILHEFFNLSHVTESAGRLAASGPRL